MSPVRAFIDGVLTVARAPLVIAAVSVVMIALTLPFAAALGAGLEAALVSQPPVVLAETEIDADWWREFRNHTRGLAATFMPAVIGVAAPLENISALLDGRPPQRALLAPLAVSMAAWAFLWGGILTRYYERRAIGVRAFITTGLALFARFAGIACVAVVIVALLFLALRPHRFGPLFLVPAVFVGLSADYARAALVAGHASSLSEALQRGARFTAGHLISTLAIAALAAVLLVGITALYTAVELSGAIDVMSWRAIVLGQLYILARLAIRLVGAASALRLLESRAMPR